MARPDFSDYVIHFTKGARPHRARYVNPPPELIEIAGLFGSLAINHGSPVEVQAWMGHSNIQTTMRYLHYKSRGDEAARLGPAFQVGAPASTTASTERLQAFAGIHSNAPADEETPASIAYLADRRESA